MQFLFSDRKSPKPEDDVFPRVQSQHCQPSKPKSEKKETHKQVCTLFFMYTYPQTSHISSHSHTNDFLTTKRKPKTQFKK